MSPRYLRLRRPIRLQRPGALPKHILTATRKNKIRQFKEFCKMSARDYGKPGSQLWKSTLVDFIDEPTVTVEDVNRWIWLNPWITTDESSFDGPARSSPNMGNQNDADLYNGSNTPPSVGSSKWSMVADDGRSSTSSNHSPTSTDSASVEEMTPDVNSDYEDQLEFKYARVINSPNDGWRTQTSSPTSWSWEEESVHQVTSPAAPNTNVSNLRTNQLMELEDDDLYSEEVLAGLIEIAKHLAPVNKLCGRLEVVRTLLLPLEKMANTVHRVQLKCFKAIQQREAMAEEAARIQTSKMKHQDDDSQRSSSQGAAVVGGLIGHRGFCACGRVFGETFQE